MKLGIKHGDVISAEPHFEYMENGRIRSRYIDDKAAVAASLATIKYLKEIILNQNIQQCLHSLITKN
jgi:putative aminopeptidase FrvX